ncbi:carbonic anhydrase 7-like [Leptidea sinapis]|uniref:carbonic anhydrase 7-like n=1 Tax=Leptidea sinapis TaxID=189913 RepID=UPI00212D44FD|nr:carbonic anhydrase 7-like [Leptidea sinapis]
MFEAIVILLLVGVKNSLQSEHWSYDYETRWPGECTEGKYQSPINIMTRSAIVDKHGLHIRGPLFFRGYDRVNVTAVNNGHTLKWTIVEDFPTPLVSGGPLRGNYSFLQFHLHWLSEHAIDGMKYPMEIHMVHIKTGLTVDEALERPDGLAVLAVLCQVSSEGASEFALGEIAAFFPQLVDRNSKYPNPAVIDVFRLMSPEPQSFYTYHGSLTTPMCQEVVTWIVMDQPLIISDTQYKEISRVDVGRIDNYRSLQPVNREIYRSVPSCGTLSLPTLLCFLTSLIHLSSSLTGIISKGVCTLVNVKRKFLGSKVRECNVKN